MAAAETVEQLYRYPFASALNAELERPQLALAASGAPLEQPLYFSGTLKNPQVAAGLLLAASEVALHRYYYPPGMVAAMIRAADPVVTAAGGRLRFESFSQCCGVYARADMLPDMLDAEAFGKGTTNVDFNPPMRAALSKIHAGSPLDLKVTPEAVEIRSGQNQETEHKVDLPMRWLKGFAEVQALAAGLEQRTTLSGPAARQFLSGLSKQVKARDRTWLIPSGNGLRLSQRATDNAIAAGGLGRLSPMKPLARHAEALHIYSSPSGISAFELDFGSARFMLVLSAFASRGFSGEGQLLKALSTADSDAALARVKAALTWQSDIRSDDLARDLKVPEQQVQTALSLLAAQGLIGADPHEQCYFHRVLPFDLSKIEGLHPRLKAARALYADGAVDTQASSDGSVLSNVRTKDATHRVQLDDDDFKCTCVWHSRTLGQSGPCKHVLAAMIASEEGLAKT